MNTLFDLTGREVAIGDVVAYPARRGRMRLAIAKVVNVAYGAGGFTLHCRNAGGRWFRIRNPEIKVLIVFAGESAGNEQERLRQ